MGKRSGEATRTPDPDIAALQQADAARVNDLAGQTHEAPRVSAIDPQRVAKRSWFRSTLRESVLLALISYFAMSVLYLTASGYKKTKDTTHIVGGYGGESVSESSLKDKGFSTFLDQNPPLKLRPENGISPSTNASRNVILVTKCRRTQSHCRPAY